MRKFNVMKKILAAVLSATLVLGTSAVALAAEVETPVYEPDDPEPQVVGSAIASGSGTIYSSGSFNVYLTSGNAFADIQVGSNSSSDAGSLSCSVTFPNGSTYDLGSILASGGSSSPREFTWCPAGTYKFTFSASKNVKHPVWATIYD